MRKQRISPIVYIIGLSAVFCLSVASGSLAQTISTVAGNGTSGATGDGGAATSAQLGSPKFIIVDNANDWLIADRDNHKIRKVNVSGFISTFAGTGTNGAAGDGGAATSAQLDGPSAVAVDASGNVYISDGNNHKIRKVDTGGNISTFAGTGVGGYSGDGGAATSAQIQSPLGIAIDASGNLYIADNNNHRIRKVDTGGNISTVAGNGSGGFSGDGGAATSAQLNFPTGVAVDASGNIYIVDQSNHRIRKVDTGGNISTVAGNGSGGFSGDGGAATSAQINSPVGIAVDATGNIYIGDQSNHRIRKVDIRGIMTTIAGTGSNGYNSDGIAPTSAQLNFPNGVFAKGDYLFVADNGNHRIRRFELTPDLKTTAPTNHQRNAPVANNISATFSQSMTAATTSSFRAFGTLTGKLSGAYSGNSTTTLTFDPTANFKSGEEVEVIFTSGSTIGSKNKAGTPLATSFVYRFRTAATAGPGNFASYKLGIGGGGDNSWGVAAGDVDGDGDTDVLIGNASTSQNVAYLNNGSGNFSSTVNFGTGSDGTLAVEMGDLDGDGDLDVAVGNSPAQDVAYLNNGSGTFSAGSNNFGSGSDNTQALALGDMDGDGDLDIVTAVTGPANNVISLNNGSGTFAGAVSFGASENTHTIDLADVNGDGDLDVVVGNAITHLNIVHFNDGTGSFSGSNTYGTNLNSNGLAVGDIDGDGDADIVMGHVGAQNAVFLNDGSGAFGSSTNFGTGTDNSEGIAIGDADGDGDLDIAVGNGPTAQNVYYVNSGGSFGTSSNFGDGTDYTVDLTMADVDGDGDLEIVAANASSGQNFAYLNANPPTVSSTTPTANTRNAAVTSNVSAVFSEVMTAATTTSFVVHGALSGKRAGAYSGASSTTITFDPSADFKAGEVVQAVFTAGTTIGQKNKSGVPLAKGRVWQFHAAASVGDAQFSDYELSFGTGTDNTFSLTLGDVDADGDLDIAVGNTSQQNITYLNQGEGNLTVKNFGTGSDGTYSTVLADIDGDGDLDVGVGNNSAQDAFYLNDGAGNWGTNRDFGSASSTTRELAMADVDGDGDLDIGVVEYGLTNNAYINDGAGNFPTSKVIDSGFLNSISLTFADVDNDGDLDAAVGQDGQQGRVYTNDGSGTFASGNTVGGGSDKITWLDFGDVDGDGDADLAAAKNGGQQNQVFLNNGSGDFSTTRNFGPGGDNTEGVRLADIDGDGDLEVAGVSATHANEAYLNDGSGNFSTTRSYGSGSDDTRAIAVGDINGDGIIDVLAGNFSAGNVAYINGTAPTVTAVSPTSNKANTSRTSNIVPTFSASMSTGSTAHYKVTSSLRGTMAGVYGGGGTTQPSFDPTSDLLANEEITVHFTAGFSSLFTRPGGLPLNKPYIWKFRAAVGSSPANLDGVFKSFGTGTDNTYALAAADVDADGDIDVGVGNSGGQNVVYLNASTDFSTARTFGSGSDLTQALAFADVDADGDLDVAAGNNGAQNSAYLNDGSGNFSTTKNFGTGTDATLAIAFGDFNGDGGMDVAVGNNAGQGVVYLNDGSGNLSGSSTNIGGASDPIAALAVADADNDGDLDIAAAYNGAQSLVYINGGSANFGGTANFGGASTQTTSVDFADISGDGHADLVVSNNTGQDEAYLNNGSASFSTVKTIGSSGSTGQAIALADIDGDGDLDALRTQQGGQNAAYINDGSGNFSTAKNFGTNTSDTRAVLAFDADLDLDIDVAEGNGSASGQNAVHLNILPVSVSSLSPTANLRNAARTSNISGTFSSAMTTPSATNFPVFSAYKGKRPGTYSGGGTSTLSFDPSADFAAGERVEAVFSASSTSGVRSTTNAPLAHGYVWRFVAAAGVGPGKFTGTGLSMGGASDNSRAIAFADIEGDGDLDALVGNNGQQSAAYINNGSSFGGGTRTIGGASDATYALHVADLDGDGDADAATGKSGAQNVAYLNDGSGNFSTTKNFGTGTDATQGLALGDVDGDGDQDIATGNNAAQNIAYLNDGSGNFAAAKNFGGASNATVVVVLGDVDGDGDLDVGAGNNAAQNAVYLNDGFANFTAGTKNFGTGSDNTQALFLDDIDGDGDLDVGVGNNNAQNAAYLNDGSGNFAAGIKNFGTGADATQSLALGDVDGDGDFDVAVGNNAAQSAVYLNDGSGNFAAGTQNFATSTDVVQAIAFADINGDLDLELGVGLNGQQSLVLPNGSFVESKAAIGLVGAKTVAPGSEVTALTLGVTGDGVEFAQSLALTLSDLSAATGLLASDFSALKVYMSSDSLYDASDSLMATNTTVNVGSSTTLSYTHIAPKDSLRYYIVRVATASAATAGHAFRVGFAAGGLTSTMGTLGSAVSASDSNKYTLTPPLVESTPAAGLDAVHEVAAGAEIKLLSIGLTGNGSETFTSIALTLSDLSTATGIDTGDVQALKLYASADTALSTSADSLIATQSTLSFSTTTTLAAPVADAPPVGVERFYIVAAKIDTTAMDGRAFKVGFASGGVASSQGTLGTAVAASDSHTVKVQVVATRLAFSQQPADSTVVDLGDEVVSGKVFSRQPIVAAQDVYGNIDINFAENITLALASGSGTLSGVLTKAFVSGLADYNGSNLTYAATKDGESFVLSADDEVGGIDLTAVSSSTLSADAVATKLAFTKQPAPLLDPGVNFAPDTVIVKAQNALGLTDEDYAANIYLRAVAAEDSALAVDSLKTVPADSIWASGGVVAWTELVLKEADLVRLTAKSGVLQAALSNVVAIPGGLTAGNADTLVATNALVGLAGVGGANLVLNALAMRANGERMPLLELRVRPTFGGLTSEELRHIDVVYDADADGRVDSSETSILAAALDDLGSGSELTLSVRDTLPADTLRYYLVVADLDHTVRATDSLRIDLTGISVGSGLSTGVTPSVPVSEVAGRRHVATGAVDMISAELSNPRIGQSGQLAIVFDAVSDLVAGDEISIDFPVGFDVSAATVDAATKTPSGSDPSLAAESAGRTIVLDLNATEGRGRYEIVLAGIKNPNVDQGAAPIGLYTRRDDNEVIDAADPQALGLALAGLGQVRVDSVSVLPHHVGAEATLQLDFVTATTLAASDEVALIFPEGFSLASARWAATSSTPSGTIPALGIDTTANELVLDLAAAEEAGHFALVLEGIGLPASARSGQVVTVRTRSAAGGEIDQPDVAPPTFSISGQLLLEAGASVPDGLSGRAGSAATAIPLTSFALKARGEAVAPQAIALSIDFAGHGKTALEALDVLMDRDGDGAVDSGDSSLAVSVGAISAQGQVEIALDTPLIASGERHAYLIVGDFSSALGAADQIRVDVRAVQAGVGQTSALPVVSSGEAIVGPQHTASGFVDMQSVELEKRQAGQRGVVKLLFSTATALEVGGQIELHFPEGFDLSQTSVDSASRTPVGHVPEQVNALSTRRILVLEVTAAEAAGRYSVVLQEVVNTSAATGLSIGVRTQRADGRALDGADPSPFLFDIEELGLPAACRADFDGDGRVYFTDLFLFGDAFGRAESTAFDLDGDGAIDFTDFFIFSEVFAQRCDPTQIEPGGEEPLPLELEEELPGGQKMAFVLVRAGAFAMGSVDGEEGRNADEGPVRQVSLSADFYLGQYEVTQGQWTALMNSTPWLGQPAVLDIDTHPAVYISWSDAQAFIQALNAAAGDSLYRLPSEAEWEYAARAGTTTRWSFGDDVTALETYAWTRTVPPLAAELITHPVGAKRANSWDLYDMHGSSGEWVQDFYAPYPAGDESDPTGASSGTERVLRGGGTLLSAEQVRSAARAAFSDDVRLSTFGLRVLKRIP